MVSYYAHIDENNKVVQVVTGIDENETIEGLKAVEWYSNFTGIKNVVTYIDDPNKKYAGIGDLYLPESDNFISPIEESKKNES